MKKLLSIVIAVIMCCTVTVTAFAATPDEAPAKDMQAIIKQAMLDYYYTDVIPSDIDIFVFGVTSNNCMLFRYDDDLPKADVIIETILGQYKYKCPYSEKILMYKDGKVYDIPSAYKSGIIDDDILKELVKYDIGVIPNSNPSDATSATKPVSTKDTATKDTPNNSQNNNGAVQTGQSSFVIILAVAMIAGCGMIFAKRRNEFE